MKDQENERELDEFDWERRHGVEFLQAVLWELGLDEEPEESLIEVLKTVHEITKLYVFDTESAQRYAYDCNSIDTSYSRVYASARQKRINARRKRKSEAADDSLPWE